MQFKKARKKGRATCLLFVVGWWNKIGSRSDLIMRSSGGYGSGFRIQIFTSLISSSSSSWKSLPSCWLHHFFIFLIFFFCLAVVEGRVKVTMSWSLNTLQSKKWEFRFMYTNKKMQFPRKKVCKTKIKIYKPVTIMMVGLC